MVRAYPAPDCSAVPTAGEWQIVQGSNPRIHLWIGTTTHHNKNGHPRQPCEALTLKKHYWVFRQAGKNTRSAITQREKTKTKINKHRSKAHVHTYAGQAHETLERLRHPAVETVEQLPRQRDEVLSLGGRQADGSAATKPSGTEQISYMYLGKIQRVRAAPLHT